MNDKTSTPDQPDRSGTVATGDQQAGQDPAGGPTHKPGNGAGPVPSAGQDGSTGGDAAATPAAAKPGQPGGNLFEAQDAPTARIRVPGPNGSGRPATEQPAAAPDEPTRPSPKPSSAATSRPADSEDEPVTAATPKQTPKPTASPKPSAAPRPAATPKPAATPEPKPASGSTPGAEPATAQVAAVPAATPAAPKPAGATAGPSPSATPKPKPAVTKAPVSRAESDAAASRPTASSMPPAAPPWHRVPGQERPIGADEPEQVVTADASVGELLNDGPTTYIDINDRGINTAPSRPRDEDDDETATTRTGGWPARSGRSRPPRQAALQLKRLDPWSVLKLALVLAVVLFFIWLVAVGVLYGVLDGMGVWDRLNGTYADLVSGEAATGSPLISAGRVLGLAAVIGAINSLLFAVAATVAAFVYNVSADLVGGIEVTLSERD